MKIQEIDKNFDTTFQCPEDIQWFSVEESPFSIHGVSFSEKEGLYRRLPKEIADATNEGVAHLSYRGHCFSQQVNCYTLCNIYARACAREKYIKIKNAKTAKMSKKL